MKVTVNVLVKGNLMHVFNNKATTVFEYQVYESTTTPHCT